MASAKQKEIIERIRKAKNRLVSSDVLRVYNSDLYDFQPVRRAILLAITFLQVKDEDVKVPEESPYKGNYTGWCYASQKFLAFRAGTTEPVVYQTIKLFKKDDVVKERIWWDSMGYPHAEYHVVEDVVTAHQRPEGFMEHDRSKQPRRGGNEKANAASFKPGWKAAKTNLVGSHDQPNPQPSASLIGSHEPTKSTATSQPNLLPLTDGCELGEGGLSLGGKVLEGFSSSSSATVRSLASAASPSADAELVSADAAGEQEEKQKTSKANGSNADRFDDSSLGQRREDFAGRHTAIPKRTPQPELAGKHTAPKKSLTNKDTYRWLYDEWKAAGGGRVPHCKRCDARLDWDEAAHVCPGFVPRFGETDWEMRDAKQAQIRESRLDEMRESHNSHYCDDCGEELLNEEHAIEHAEDCPAREEWDGDYERDSV